MDPTLGMTDAINQLTTNLHYFRLALPSLVATVVITRLLWKLA